MRILKPLVLALFGLLASAGLAQIPAPQINLSGNIGCQGFPCFNNGTLIFSVDANHSMTAQESSAQSPSLMKVTSSVSLTATRNLITPAGRFSFTIENATTGGQSIQIIGPSGTGVTIANGTTVSVGNDGTNFVQVGASGGGSGLNQLTGDVLAGPGTGSQAATLATVNGSPGTCGDATHVCQIVDNAKGLVTSQTQVAITGSGTCAIGTCILNAGTASQTITESPSFGLGYVGTSWGINPVFNNSADFSEAFGHFIADITDMGGSNGGKGGSLHRQTITFDNPGYDWGYSVNGSTQWFTGIGEIPTTNFNAAGIGSALAPTINHPSVGDSIGIALIDQVNGGYQALSDEGAVGNRVVVQEGSSSAGLVVSGGTTGSQSMVVNVTQPLGVGRIIYDTAATTGVISTTQTLGSSTAGIQTVNLGTTVAQSTCGILAGGPIVATTAYSITSNVITINGTNSVYQNENITLSGYGTSTFLNGQSVFVIASTGTAFTAAFTHANVSLTTEAGAFNTVNVDTPRQANNGSISMTFGITLGSAYVGSTTALISMGGTGFIDTSQLSAVGSYTGGIQYVTAPLIHPILSGATVCMGGLAGYGELNTTSPFGGYLNFIIGSPTTNTALTVAIPAGRPTTGYAKAGSVTLYPIAVIQSIAPASTPTVAVTPNSVAWANGDTISIPNGITAQYASGEYEITNRNSYASYSGLSSLYTGPATFQGGSLFTALGNETASTLTSQGGLGFAPTVMDIIGHVGMGLHFRGRPSNSFSLGNIYPNALLMVDGCPGGFTCPASYYVHADGTNSNPGTGIEFFPATGIYNFHGSTAAVIQQNGTAVCLQSGSQCPAFLANPMTTLGDIITGGASGTPGRLGIGSTGQVLEVVAGVPAWQTVTGTGTVTHTVGALTALQLVVGNGGGDVKVDPNASTDGAGNITAASYTAVGTTPGAASLVAGTGSIPTLPANSFGFAAPVTGGTSYLFKAPATITAGIAHFAAPATADGVNESALTSSAVNLASADVTGLLPVANGGTGTSTPGIVAGTNVTVTGTWPNQTVNSSGGGGAAFPGTNNIVFNTSTTASRNATSADVIALWTGSCSSSTFLRGDGACAGPAGSGTVTTSGSPTTGFFSLFTGATVIGNSHLDDGITNAGVITSSENFAALAGTFSAGINSSSAAANANTFAGEAVINYGPGASGSALLTTGTPFSGTGTTSTPLVYLSSIATGPSTWSTVGTYFGMNAAPGFSGNLLDFHVNGGASVAKIDSGGNLTVTSCTGCGGGGTPAYPLTITGGVSGGIVYGSSATQLTVSPAGTAGQAVLWGGAGTAPTALPVNGAGAGLASGPISSVNNDLVAFQGTLGQLKDTSILSTNLMLLTTAQTVGGAKTFTSAIVSNGTITSTLGTAAITSATGGTGVTSVTCATAACNVSRGSYTVVGGTATTGTIITLLWPTTTTAWVCSVDMNGGTGFLGIGHSVATATGMNITAGLTVVGVTFTVDYSCVP